MTEHPGVTVYVSEASETCGELLKQLRRWNIQLEVKNITKDSSYRKELQNRGIYGTPATFINGFSKAILGFQKRKLQQALQVEDAKQSNVHEFLLNSNQASEQ